MNASSNGLKFPKVWRFRRAAVAVDRVGPAPREFKSVEDLDGMIVNVDILEFPADGDQGVGRVVEILGHPDDFGVDVEVMIRKHHLPHHFPQETVDEARAISHEIPRRRICAAPRFPLV